MFKSRIILLFLMMSLLSSLNSCSGSGSAQKEMGYKMIPEIKEIRPERPVKIKLKRNTKGNYSWELNGDNVDRIIEIDKKLRDAIKESRSHKRR
jgi:hypothetical protein